MAKITRHNFDIVDLANKYRLVGWDKDELAVKSYLQGSDIHLKELDEDGNNIIKTVESHYCDYSVDMIYIIFEGETVAQEFLFGSKFTVDVDEGYKAIKVKIRGYAK